MHSPPTFIGFAPWCSASPSVTARSSPRLRRPLGVAAASRQCKGGTGAPASPLVWCEAHRRRTPTTSVRAARGGGMAGVEAANEASKGFCTRPGLFWAPRKASRSAQTRTWRPGRRSVRVQTPCMHQQRPSVRVQTPCIRRQKPSVRARTPNFSPRKPSGRVRTAFRSAKTVSRRLRVPSARLPARCGQLRAPSARFQARRGWRRATLIVRARRRAGRRSAVVGPGGGEGARASDRQMAWARKLFAVLASALPFSFTPNTVHLTVPGAAERLVMCSTFVSSRLMICSTVRAIAPPWRDHARPASPRAARAVPRAPPRVALRRHAPPAPRLAPRVRTTRIVVGRRRLLACPDHASRYPCAR